MSNNFKVKVGDRVKLNRTGIEAGLTDKCWHGAGTDAIEILKADPGRKWTVCYTSNVDMDFRLEGLDYFWTLDVFDVVPVTLGQRLKRIFTRK